MAFPTGIHLTSLKYSPTSACRKATILVGSSDRACAVDRAVIPNPYQMGLAIRVATLRTVRSTHQRRIVHRHDHHSLMLGAIITPSPDVCLHDIPSIEERHNAVILHP
jgi:hypothetical protein